jgi:hypothetical protein
VFAIAALPGFPALSLSLSLSLYKDNQMKAPEIFCYSDK